MHRPPKDFTPSKVPEVTLVFWIIKIAATTLGETGGDSVTMTLNWGYLAGTLLFFALLAGLVMVRTTVIDPEGCSETNDFGPGDIWYFPRGHGHVIETLGDKPCHFILVFDNGYFSEFGTFSISDWLGHAPKQLLAKNFGLPASTFDSFPKSEVYFAKGKIPPAVPSPPLQGWKPPPLTHKYSLLSQKPFETFSGGLEWRADGSQFPISTTMTGVVLEMSRAPFANSIGTRTRRSGNMC